MATEQQEEVVVDNAIEQEESDVDFESGFAGTGEEKTGTATPPDSLLEAGAAGGEGASASGATEPVQTPAPTPEPTPAPTPEPKMVSVSEEELTQLRAQAQQGSSSAEQLAAFSKKFDQAFGQIGNLKQVVDKLRTETPAGESLAVTEEDFKELAEEYPELAKLQLGALNKVLARFKGTGGVDSEAVEKTVAGKLAPVAEEMRDMVLHAVLPDWHNEVRTPAFKEWLTAQKPDIQALAASDKVPDAARMLRLYDRHQSAPKTPAPPAPTPPGATPAPTVSPKQRQIAAAVTPRGDGTPAGATPEEDEFETGFKTG